MSGHPERSSISPSEMVDAPSILNELAARASQEFSGPPPGAEEDTFEDDNFDNLRKFAEMTRKYQDADSISTTHDHDENDMEEDDLEDDHEERSNPSSNSPEYVRRASESSNNSGLGGGNGNLGRPVSTSSVNHTIKLPHEVITDGNKAKRFICKFNNCNKGFPSRGHLIRHQRTHTGEKPFKCLHQDCQKTFSRYDNMLQHFKTHVRSQRRNSANTNNNGSNPLSSNPAIFHQAQNQAQGMMMMMQRQNGPINNNINNMNNNSNHMNNFNNMIQNSGSFTAPINATVPIQSYGRQQTFYSMQHVRSAPAQMRSHSVSSPVSHNGSNLNNMTGPPSAFNGPNSNNNNGINYYGFPNNNAAAAGVGVSNSSMNSSNSSLMPNNPSISQPEMLFQGNNNSAFSHINSNSANVNPYYNNNPQPPQQMVANNPGNITQRYSRSMDFSSTQPNAMPIPGQGQRFQNGSPPNFTYPAPVGFSPFQMSSSNNNNNGNNGNNGNSSTYYGNIGMNAGNNGNIAMPQGDPNMQLNANAGRIQLPLPNTWPPTDTSAAAKPQMSINSILSQEMYNNNNNPQGRSIPGMNQNMLGYNGTNPNNNFSAEAIGQHNGMNGGPVPK